MISLIICSRTSTIEPIIKANIEATIGYPHEYIVIDNSANNYNIFEAYNLGIEKSKGEIVCFLHDDILFHTKNWGSNVATYFKDLEIGAIGIAGTPYVPKTPGSWWGGRLINQQQLALENGALIQITRYVNNQKEKKREIIVLDGVWFCIRKSLFNTIHFDNGSYNGFHFYDTDIAMQVYQSGHRLFAIYDILIEHNSKGTINSDWIKSAQTFNQKWKSVLPLSCEKLAFNTKCAAELRTMEEFAQIKIGNNLPTKKSYLFAIKQILLNYRLYFSYYTPKYFINFLKKI